MVIAIDPGHGGRDWGAVGRRGTKEKEVALRVASLLEEVLSSSGVDVVLTRCGDEFVSPEQRVCVANEAGAHLFVSIHCSWCRSPRVSGIQTFYFYGSRRGHRLAAALQRSLASTLSESDRGVKEAGFCILRRTLVPASVVCLGYLSNPAEEKSLAASSVQRAAAEAISRAILELADRPHPAERL